MAASLADILAALADDRDLALQLAQHLAPVSLREERDTLLCRYVAVFCKTERSARAKAGRAYWDLRRYELAGWRHDRHRVVCPHADERHALMWRTLKCGPLPSVSTIRAVISPDA